MKKILIILLIICALPLTAQNIEITQIDTAGMLFKGTADIYFTFPADNKNSISAEDFTVTEKTAGDLEILSLTREPNKESGIDFILLIDNSGSMYEESYQGKRRIDQAKLALNSFLDQIDSTKDRAAIYAFNTSLIELAPLGSDIPTLRRSLSGLTQPEADQSYTELYNSLSKTSGAFPGRSGRKAVIALSDGENYPLSVHGGTEHTLWGTAVSTPDEIVQRYHQTGITIDGINISDDMDASLQNICAESGGKFHDVRSTEAISEVYSRIKERITNEFMLSVKTPPLKDSRGYIELRLDEHSDGRMLAAPILFGSSDNVSILICLLALLTGLAGLAGLFIIPFEKPVKNAQIQSLNTNQKTILNNGATVIGAAREADFTLAGNPGIDAEHATILQDEETGKFTIVSTKPVRVNNRRVNNRTLTAGDVIRIEDSTIIFDEPESTKI